MSGSKRQSSCGPDVSLASSAMSTANQCIFCGSPAGSREHIVGKWLLNDLGLYSSKTKMGFGYQQDTGGMDEIMEPQPLGSFVIDSVCGKCNNGWMSQLENKAKRLLTPLLVDPFPDNNRHLFSALFLESHMITRWLLKSACTFGVKMSCEVPQYIRDQLYNGYLHPEVMADISVNDECGLYIGISRSWACYTNEKLDAMQVPNESFRFVWQLRHIALRVAYFPGCHKMMTRPKYPVRLHPKFCVPPDVEINGKLQAAYKYPTLESVEHDTIYTPKHEHPHHIPVGRRRYK